MNKYFIKLGLSFFHSEYSKILDKSNQKKIKLIKLREI